VDLFVGVGRSEVSLHAAEYLRSAGGSVLAELRSALAQLGLSRQSGVSLFEDHLAAVLETMRVLIAGGPDVEPHAAAEQSVFFEDYVSTWVPQCCAAIIALADVNDYRLGGTSTALFRAVQRV